MAAGALLIAQIWVGEGDSGADAFLLLGLPLLLGGLAIVGAAATWLYDSALSEGLSPGAGALLALAIALPCVGAGLLLYLG